MRAALLPLVAAIAVACGTASTPTGQLHPTSSSPASGHEGRHHHLVVVRFSPLATPTGLRTPIPAPVTSSTPMPPTSLSVSVDDTSFTPPVMIVSAGDVTFQITNRGQRPHSFRVTDPAADPIARSAPIPPGLSIDFEISNLSPGSYTVTDTQTDQEETAVQADLEVS